MRLNDARFVQEGTVIGFGLTVVELDDCELSACVVVPENDTQQDKRAKRSQNEETAWQALMFVHNVAGENDNLTTVRPPKKPVQKAVQTALVQDEFRRRYGTDRTTTLRAIDARWSEAKKGLTSKGYCALHNEYVWPIFA